MKQMKVAYRSAMRSESLPALVQHLKTITRQSAQQHYPASRDAQMIYQQSFEQLQKDYAVIEQDIARQDLAAAKAALERVRQTEKTYHQKLDV